ncbi:hypothetical protein [Flavobacterium cerinum]|uniref:Uncharacterized protein n=1 Tax=Flavobacterium cerinum TaxID=2502784 RepID=A0A444GLF1_9FLAO|nr:hypothetical protein [Flavobacterium cerinum]RWW91840.1 hypothetical protein EPI11_17515 [Flavobacterium cerinum]
MATQAKLMTLFTKYGIDEKQRHELIYAWTSGRTESTKDLHGLEIDDLCEKLEADFRYRTNIDAYTELEKKSKRSIVLTIAQRTAIHDPANWKKFNDFMLNSSIHKKRLNDYELNELDELIKQFRGLERNYNKSSNKAGTKAYFHSKGLPNVNPN